MRFDAPLVVSMTANMDSTRSKTRHFAPDLAVLSRNEGLERMESMFAVMETVVGAFRDAFMDHINAV